MPVAVHLVAPIELCNSLVWVALRAIKPEPHARAIVRHHPPRMVPHLRAKVRRISVHLFNCYAPCILWTRILASRVFKAPRPIGCAGIIKQAVFPPSLAVTFAEWNLIKPLICNLTFHLDYPGPNVGFAFIKTKVSVEMLPAGRGHFHASLLLAKVE